jgi:hypothetical protein
MSVPYAAGMAAIAAHLAWQVWRIDLQRPELSFRLFLSNILTGLLLACSALVGDMVSVDCGSGATIEIAPVLSSRDTREVVARYLDQV